MPERKGIENILEFLSDPREPRDCPLMLQILTESVQSFFSAQYLSANFDLKDPNLDLAAVACKIRELAAIAHFGCHMCQTHYDNLTHNYKGKHSSLYSRFMTSVSSRRTIAKFPNGLNGPLSR